MAFRLTPDNIVKPTPEGAIVALSKVQYDRLLKILYARVDELFCRLVAFHGSDAKPYELYQIEPFEYIEYTIGMNAKLLFPLWSSIGFDTNSEQLLSVSWSRHSKYYSYSIIAPVSSALRTVSVDVVRQLWRGQTRMASALYRSRLDDGAEVLLRRRQDSECSLSIFLHSRNADAEKMKQALTNPCVWDDNPRTALANPSAVVDRAFRRIAFSKKKPIYSIKTTASEWKESGES